MMKQKYIPTRIVLERPRPKVHGVARPSRMRRLRVFWTMLRTAITLAMLRVRRQATPERDAEIVRSMLEALGGLWIKVGQLLSARRDLFDPRFCEGLTALKDHVTAFEYEEAKRIIEADLGLPLGEIFSEFDERPFAAASIGQTYRARLHAGGALVAVKVKRPEIDEVVRGDRAFVRALSIVAMLLGRGRMFRFRDFFWELDKTLHEELDYRYEANHIRRMRTNLRGHGIYVPKVFREVCSARVLVTEFLTGVLISDLVMLRRTKPEQVNEWALENRVDLARVGRKLALSLYRQLYEDNMFHADLHPGNIVLLRNNKVALIDFGSVGWLDREFVDQLRDILRAISDKQYNKVADLLMLIIPGLAPIDLEPCKRQLLQMLRTWMNRSDISSLPFDEKSMGHGYTEMARITAHYGLPNAWNFLRVVRAHATLDLSLEALDPTMNCFKLVQRYSKQRVKRQVKTRLRGKALRQQVGNVLLQLPEWIGNAVDESSFQVEWMRRRARVFATSTGRMVFIGRAVSSVMATIALLGVAGVVCLYFNQTMEKPPFSPDLSAWFDKAPRLPVAVWDALFVTTGLIALQMLRIRRKLSQPDAAVTAGSKG